MGKGREGKNKAGGSEMRGVASAKDSKTGSMRCAALRLVVPCFAWGLGGIA